MNFPNRKKKGGPIQRRCTGLKSGEEMAEIDQNGLMFLGDSCSGSMWFSGDFWGVFPLAAFTFFIIGTPMPSDRQYTPRDELSKGSIFFPAKHGPWTFVGNEAGAIKLDHLANFPRHKLRNVSKPPSTFQNAIPETVRKFPFALP